MAHSDQISALALDIGSKLKATRTLLNDGAVDNTALLTTAKGSLLAAINELYGLIVANAATIDDAATDATSAWSASKIQAVVDASSVATRDAIIGGAPAEYDTLIETMNAILANDGDITGAINSIAANTTAIVASQGAADAAQATADGAVTDAAAAQAVADTATTNIAALTAAVGDTNADYVATFNTALSA